MKYLTLTSLICGGILSATSGGLLAQQSSTTDPGSSSSPSSSSSLGSSSSSQSSSSSLGSSSSSMRSGSDVRLSQLMNSTVQSQDGKQLGTLRDVTVDPQTGRLQFAILSPSAGGATSGSSVSGRETTPYSSSSSSGASSSALSSTTGKLIPIPWQLFSQSWSSQSSSSSSAAGGMHNLTVNIDQSKLQSAPSFDASNWNQLQTGTLDQQVYSHFGVDRNSATGTSGSSISGQGASSYEHKGSSTSGSQHSSGGNEGSTSPTR